MRHVLSALAVALLVCVLWVATPPTPPVVAAPVPKDKKIKEEPATAAQKKQAENNLKQIMIAVHAYHDANGVWPQDTPSGLSWRVQLLPYLEEEALYKQFNLNEAWDSDTNKKLIDSMPKVFAATRPLNVEKGETFLRGFAGSNPATAGVFQPGRLTIASITDGTSNTVAVIDAGEPVTWTKPGTDLDPDAKEFPKLGRMIDGDYFFAAMCDGSVRKVKREFDEKGLKAAISRAGGEIFDEKGVFAK